MVKAEDQTEVIHQLTAAMRRANALSVIESHEAASRIGIHQTDMECLDLLSMTGPLTAGRIASMTGLTTGAITGLVDRLEERGLVERVRDPADRRKVIVSPISDAIEQTVTKEYAPFTRDVAELLSKYSDRDLELMLEFVNAVCDITLTHIKRLRGGQFPELTSDAELNS